MLRASWLCLLVAAQVVPPAPHEIPLSLRGDWVITRIIPTRTISCWDQREARGLLGTRIVYSADSFEWEDHGMQHSTATIRIWAKDDFLHEYCGGGPRDSCVDFGQLGIHADRATVLTIQHPAASITGATTEIPGDWVLLKNPDTIIVSVCNLYFDAHRR
jgi:hypothetical protein